MTVAVVVGLLTSMVARSSRRFSPIVGLVVGVGLVWPKWFLVLLGGWWALRITRDISRRRAASSVDSDEVGVLARLVLIGMSSGLSLHGVLVSAAGELRGGVAAQTSRVIQHARSNGLGPALAGTSGPASGLFGLMAGSVSSGASVVPVVTAFLHEHAAERRNSRLEQARKLPIKLTVPLTLLILPGCVLLFVGPSFVRGISELVPTFGSL